MSKARDQMQTLINKRVKNKQIYKNKTARRIGPNGIVLQFIEAMEKIQANAKDPLNFEVGLQKEANFMYKSMKAIDPDVDIEIVWNNEACTENWEELQVEGIKIKWSKWYLGKHPFNDAEKYIDVSSLFLEGYMMEDEPVEK